MAKTRKRREQKKRVPQAVRVYKAKPGTESKAATALAAKKRKINWIQIAAITIGVIVILSMILSLFLIPGAANSF